MPPRRSRPVFPGPKVAGYQRRATSGTSACLDHGVVDGREFARIIDRKPQRRSGPIGLGSGQSIGRNHTFDHVGDDRRPRAPFQLDGNRGHTPTEPERAVYTLLPRRRPEPGHHKERRRAACPSERARSKSKTRRFHRSPLCQWGVTVHPLRTTLPTPRRCHGGVRRSGGGSKAGAQPGPAGGVGRTRRTQGAASAFRRHVATRAPTGPGGRPRTDAANARSCEGEKPGDSMFVSNTLSVRCWGVNASSSSSKPNPSNGRSRSLGTIAHKAIELSVHWRRELDP